MNTQQGNHHLSFSPSTLSHNRSLLESKLKAVPARVGTRNSFSPDIRALDDHNCECIEMEMASYARVCEMTQKPFLALKIVSDLIPYEKPGDANAGKPDGGKVEKPADAINANNNNNSSPGAETSSTAESSPAKKTESDSEKSAGEEIADQFREHLNNLAKKLAEAMGEVVREVRV
jgi:hypothetical protein